ncbi:MAG: Lrp/AsnC family transcriptional regulator, partial [Pseudomonadota bacterium]
ELDSFDRRLLALLQVDCRKTGEQLSREIGLSPAACLRRVQRLRQSGAIEREVAIVSPALAPKATTIIVLLTIVQHNPKRIDDLIARLMTFDEVDTIYVVTGDADIVVIMKCASMEDFKAFADTHFYELPVEGFETIVALRTHGK